jgi:hypothetical protein
MKIWIDWSESNSWNYFYIFKIYWSLAGGPTLIVRTAKQQYPIHTCICGLRSFILHIPCTFMSYRNRGRRDRMVVGFTTIYAISVYHHKRCEFKFCSGKVYSIQHYVTQFVSDLRQVGSFLWVLVFSAESCVKHYNHNPLTERQGTSWLHFYIVVRFTSNNLQCVPNTTNVFVSFLLKVTFSFCEFDCNLLKVTFSFCGVLCQ